MCVDTTNEGLLWESRVRGGRKKVIFIKKNAFSRNFQGKIWCKCALSQPENVIATEFSKKN